MTARRFPVDPVLELAGVHIGPDEDGKISDTALAVYLNVNSDSLGRWRRRGWIGEDTAEQIAAELGRHPVNLWGAELYYPDNLEELADAADAKAAAAARKAAAEQLELIPSMGKTLGTT